MPAETKRASQPEIAHILCLDVVGYSKLLIDEQKESMRRLSEIVRNTEEFRRAEATGKLVRIPTGDGMVLAFFTSPAAPVECAVEIAQALKNYPQIELRMGVHSGPVDQVSDVNDQLNVAGSGINMAQRVMDCGDASHILVSKRVAEDLAQYARWQPQLHDLGEATVKHGIAVHIFNLCTDRIGNQAVPAKLERERQDKAAAERTAQEKWRRKIWFLAGTSAGLIALVFGVFLLRQRSRSSVPGVTTEKSIAVLPFDNLSGNPENAYFTDGIQEEILTRLAKIADLKVISRTSTARYKSSPDNLRDIANKLGVANILAGSVQRVTDQVRVNVQLIKAATDAHLWADTYDRKLTDIFAIESEIAKTIADTLQAKLTGSEQDAIAARPTANTEAHQLYLKGRFFWSKRTGPDLLKSIEYLKQAIGTDPNYALAYAGLADSCVLLSLYGAETPQQSLPLARTAAKKALELDGTLAEPHASLGMVLALFDYDFVGSIKEFELATSLNPNDATAHQWLGNAPLVIVGEFDRAIAEGKRAVELDPLSLIINADLGESYIRARRYDEAVEQLHKTIDMDKRFYYARLDLGEALQLQGKLSEALAEYKKATELTDDPLALALLAHGYARIGQRDQALKLLAQLERLATSRYVGGFSFALVHLGLGEKEKAIDDLERAYREHTDPYVLGVTFDPLRGDPRFEQLKARILGGKNTTAEARKPAP